MTTSIEILKINHFEGLDSSDWNSKVLYKKNGKTKVAVFHYCGFQNEVTFPDKQPKGHKNLKGLGEVLFNKLIKFR